MTTSVTKSLEPLEQALIRRANATADAARADAEEQARATTAAAEQQAEALLAQARAEGEADAAELQAADLGRSRREARGILLAAQRAVYDELRSRAQAAARTLLADPEQQRPLVALVQAQLGPHATVRDHPAGGVIAEAPGGRRIDASVDVLVERVLTGSDLEQLWAPH